MCVELNIHYTLINILKYVHTYHLKQTLVAKVCKDVADHDYNYVNGISHCLDFVFKNTFAARCTHIYLHLG